MNVKQTLIGLGVFCFVCIFCSVMYWCGAHGFDPGVMESHPKTQQASAPHAPGAAPAAGSQTPAPAAQTPGQE